MWTRALGLTILLLSASLVAAQGAVRASDAFAPPPFAAGTRAEYEETYSFNGGTVVRANYTIQAPSTSVAATGERVDVFVIRRDGGDRERWSEERVSLRSLTLENEWFSCSVATINPDGSRTCLPFSSIHWSQGAPGLLGATLLQGRAFQVGDAWTQEGTCLACASPITVAIEPPAASSPPGTAFVANVTGRSDTSYVFMQGLLHMAADSPYPLLAQMRNPWMSVSARLVAVAPGEGDALPIPTPPLAPDHAPPLPTLPYEGGRPVEGTPLPGRLSWAEARAATGPDPADLVGGATFLGFDYPSGRQWSYLGVSNPLYPTVPVVHRVVSFESETFRFASEYALPNGSVEETEYGRSRSWSTLLDAPNPLYQEPAPSWSARSSWSPRAYPSGCPDESAALWDVVRVSQGTGLVGEFSGFMVDMRGHYGAPDCGEAREWLLVTGDTSPLGYGLALYETLTLDLRTGYLRSGLVLPH